MYELDKTISIGFLVLLPFSWWIGYYIPKKENNKKIKKLEKNKIIMHRIRVVPKFWVQIWFANGIPISNLKERKKMMLFINLFVR